MLSPSTEAVLDLPHGPVPKEPSHRDAKKRIGNRLQQSGAEKKWRGKRREVARDGRTGDVSKKEVEKEKARLNGLSLECFGNNLLSQETQYHRLNWA